MIRQISDYVMGQFSLEDGAILGEKMLIRKYGTVEAVKERIKVLYGKDNVIIDVEQLCELMDADLKLIERFSKFLYQLNIKSINDIILLDPKVFEDAFTVDERKEIASFYNEYQDVMIRHHNSVLVSPEHIAKKIKFTKKEIREEIGVSQKTFNKWLQICFGKKYFNRRKIDLNEYLEIHTMLLLNHSEKKLNLGDPEIYKERILEGQIFTKERLIEITESDYKTLRENLKNLEYYDELDKFPLKIASLIIEKMR